MVRLYVRGFDTGTGRVVVQRRDPLGVDVSKRIARMARTRITEVLHSFIVVVALRGGWPLCASAAVAVRAWDTAAAALSILGQPGLGRSGLALAG